MISKIELKQLIIALGKKWLFPDFTNKLTWLVVTVGCGIVLTPVALKYFVYNWLIKIINLNEGVPFTLAELEADKIDSSVGVALIGFSLLHNIGSKYFNYLALTAESYNKEQSRVADIAIYQEFITDFPSDSVAVKLLSQHDFGGSYHVLGIEQIETFIIRWNDPEHQFLNKELEEKRHILWSKCHTFANKLAEYSGPIGNGPHYSVIPDMYRGEWDQPDFITERIKDLNKKATYCFELHQELITLCRKKLKC